SGGIKKALVLTFTVFLLASCGGGGGGDGGGGIDTSWLAQFPNPSINLPKIGEYVYDDKGAIYVNIKGETFEIYCDDGDPNAYMPCVSSVFDVSSWYAQYGKFEQYYNDLKSAGFYCDIPDFSSFYYTEYLECKKLIGADIFWTVIQYVQYPGVVELFRAKESAN
ncbi:MAG: hypothetical protein LBU73_08675, partial [Helicobacteraceae bacterium]|nr:hypothetical protein [Helicobacteraceae bacterium]